MLITPTPVFSAHTSTQISPIRFGLNDQPTSLLGDLKSKLTNQVWVTQPVESLPLDAADTPNETPGLKQAILEAFQQRDAGLLSSFLTPHFRSHTFSPGQEMILSQLLLANVTNEAFTLEVSDGDTRLIIPNVIQILGATDGVQFIGRLGRC